MPEYDAETALIVVDVQNDFADAEGELAVPGGAGVVAAVNAEIAAAEQGGALVAYTQDWHPEHTRHFQGDGGPWPSHCVGGTWGAAFHPALRVVNDDPIRKGAGGEDGYSGFSLRDPSSGERASTALEARLRACGVRRVVVVGLATDYCVKETALDALRLGFAVVVVRGAVRSVDLQAGDGERALSAMATAGARLE